MSGGVRQMEDELLVTQHEKALIAYGRALVAGREQHPNQREKLRHQINKLATELLRRGFVDGHIREIVE